ncbi:unnamed protein product [Didymodactylos carnosus]|uniref:Uncharacterized protein n=1 Tax=Didymodactylos carnosus TaxID=1234261 RepID=A0A815FBD9_9BILA|nr:unnamed protein product [Didymodactylos carnosus]CAF1488002.1 unnamed protein product [Didymodactylos carnosus]CAF4170210.1 unnamed protein product [Didymodactylos carnosus]CAF4277578.1 unnamed protein product [Didymodactylos carnosus]
MQFSKYGLRCAFHQLSLSRQHLPTEPYDALLHKDIKNAIDVNVQDENLLNENEERCNVFRDDEEKIYKTRSFGFLATFLNCGIICGFDESPRAEGMRRIARHLLRILKAGGKLPPAMLYDCACMFRLFIDKQYGGEYFKKSEHTDFLKNMHLAIDRFHVKNHKRYMCQTVMHPDNEIHQDAFKDIGMLRFYKLLSIKLPRRT